MRRLEIEHWVRLRHLAAALDELVGRGAQLAQPRFVDRALDEQEAVLEISLALLLRKHLRLDGENLFRCHAMSSCSLDYADFGQASGTPSSRRRAWKRRSRPASSRTERGATPASSANAASAPAASPTFHSTGCSR